MKRLFLILAPLMLVFCGRQARHEQLLETGWRFAKGDHAGAATPEFDDSSWENVAVPHDWAIYGPFDKQNDLQTVAVVQNFETVATEKTGRTGGLPYVGVGWYRRTFDVARFDREKQSITLLFDGAMSEARVYVNGQEACFWPYGYNAFHCDVTELLNPDGRGNILAVRLENRPQSARWYPGAGLYRNVKLIVAGRVHVPVWGTYITTPQVDAERASVAVRTEVANHGGMEIGVRTELKDADGNSVGSAGWDGVMAESIPVVQELVVEKPQLWSPESPYLYTAETSVLCGGKVVDTYTTRFGIRSIEQSVERGFVLNGTPRKFQGVCNHHDLGPLGAAVNTAALRRQLTLLKDMGCDAVRTSHNMPATELVELCDQMGLMVMVEPFDEWDVAKCRNGYHRFFAEWAERDMVNMLRRFRNNPSVVMWSIGNEVPTQLAPEGRETVVFLQDICHREDPTRPVTCGMDHVEAVLANGFAAALDIPGLNYRTQFYEKAHQVLPDKPILGSETASTVSSRGVYKFPVERRASFKYPDHQCSSYDVENCHWSNIPDVDFVLADDFSWTIGQFVWTGFDYLGEPSPYDTDSWPNHSSMFGIIDLASIPKDRYYLYRSIWNTESHTLHMLPHWTWPEREGQTTPVFVYTDYPEAELFINGKSQGRRAKNDASLMERYRLMWMDAVYEPGEIKVVAYDADGKIAEEKITRTAGEPYRIELVPDRSVISADGKDLSYITVSIVDRDGNLCPHDGRMVDFEVSGQGRYRAGANGDPTCLDIFHLPRMHAFGGKMTAIVQSAGRGGNITVKARAKGLEPGYAELKAK